MLKAPAQFPYPGSAGYLSPGANPVRIIQRNADGSLLVARTDRAPALRSASDTFTASAASVHPTEAATQPAPRRRRAS